MRFYICLLVCLGSSFFGYAAPHGEISSSEFYSQSCQDQFVYTLLYRLLDKQDTGYYLEIGAGHPTYINNSYFLEKNLNWKGVSIDISNTDWFPIRKNSFLVEDATKANYVAILQSFPRVIDYLSLDIDKHYDTVLQRIPLDNYIFKIITIEHDFYRFGDIYRANERRILASQGYYLLCPDVLNEGYIYEDWWIHPSAFPTDVFTALTSLDLKAKDHKEILQIIKTQLFPK